MTAIEDGVRVDYQFVVSGRESWTNRNRPLLTQMGVRQGRSLLHAARDAVGGRSSDTD
jgi:hypothetical protein